MALLIRLVQNLLPKTFDWGTPPGFIPLEQASVFRQPFALVTAPPPLPFNQRDWPLSGRYPPLVPSWTFRGIPIPPYDATRIPLPFDWGTPDGPIQPIRSWELRPFNLFTVPAVPPFIQEDWPLPSRGPEYAISLRTWTVNLQQTTLQPIPYGEQFFDRPFPLGPPPLLPIWTWSYNLNLIGKDQLPTGAEISDLPPRAYPEPATRTWAWWYNLNLIGKDRMLAGEQVFDLTPIAQPQILPRSWTWSYNLNLIGQDQLPTGEAVYERPTLVPTLLQTWISAANLALTVTPTNPFFQLDWPLTPAPIRSIDLSTWISQTKLLLAVPFKQIDWPIPRAPQQPIQTWISSSPLILSPSLNVPFKQLDWPLTPAAQQPIPIFTATYNKNLVGQDKLPTGAEITDLPPQPPLSSIELRTWITVFSLPRTVEGAIPPFNQYSWPLTPAPQQPVPIFTATYNKNLIGQDVLPTGDQITDLWPKGYEYPITLRSWTVNLRQTTLQPLPYGIQISERPPLGPQQPDRFWSWSYNLNLIGQDQLPVGAKITDLTPSGYIYSTQLRTWIDRFDLPLFTVAGVQPPTNYDWPVPKGPLQPDRSYGFTFIATLRGQDRLPTGKQVFELWPRPQAEPATRTWAYSFPLNLRGQDLMTAGDQFTDLPPRDYQRSIQLRSFTASYNLNLIGKDRLPAGQQYTALTPAGYITPIDIRSWINRVNLALIVPPGAKPFNQQDWPVPRPYPYPTQNRIWANPLNLNLSVPIPIPPAPRRPEFVFNPGNEWQYYDRAREPGPIGWR